MARRKMKKTEKEMIKYSRLWETNPLNKLSTSLFFLVSASKSGTRGGAKLYAAQSVSLLQSDSTELKNPISALQVPDKLHRILMLMCLGIFLQPTMSLRELKRTKCFFFPGIFFMNFNHESLMEILNNQNAKKVQNSRYVVCRHLLKVQSVQADKTN